jgi:hypothetical protein
LAARWGYIWELNGPVHDDRRLTLEWLESSAWTGEPYRARRIVLDDRNLDVMTRRMK